MAGKSRTHLLASLMRAAASRVDVLQALTSEYPRLALDDVDDPEVATLMSQCEKSSLTPSQFPTSFGLRCSAGHRVHGAARRLAATGTESLPPSPRISRSRITDLQAFAARHLLAARNKL
jgi:hypothetical protein